VDWWEAIWTGVLVGLAVAAMIAVVHWYLGRRETKAREAKARIPLGAGALLVVPEIRTNAEVAKRCEEGYHVSAEATFVSLTQWKDFKNQIAGLQAEDPELWRELEETYGALEQTKARAAQPPQSAYLLTLADRLENAAERNG
jgi:hypothetical protein